jgi:hypothetical protein
MFYLTDIAVVLKFYNSSVGSQPAVNLVYNFRPINQMIVLFWIYSLVSLYM